MVSLPVPPGDERVVAGKLRWAVLDGTYDIEETPPADPRWSVDVAPQQVMVAAPDTAQVTVTNLWVEAQPDR